MGALTPHPRSGARAAESLEAAIDGAGGAVALLRHSPIRPHTFPVRAEFTNWRSEQRAWRDGCALLDQSHHMTDLFLDGPGVTDLLSTVGVNSLAQFAPGRAKQYVAVSPEGYLIGDAILFHLFDGRFDLVGHPMVLDWVAYQALSTAADVELTWDADSVDRPTGPPVQYRFELQGPAAGAVLAGATGAAAPALGFFGMAVLAIAGCPVTALRHGMAGQPGYELFGPWGDGEAVRERLLDAGLPLGLTPVGAKAYSTANLESGWVPAPLPAIFSSAQQRDYREWLPAVAAGSLAGSLLADAIDDYYLTPYDLGYGRHVALDHDFIGRDALAQVADRPSRRKVTLVWDPDDVAALTRSLCADRTPAKYLELPKARYGLHQADEVLRDGHRAGISMDAGYIANERAMVSLACVEPEWAEPGTELTLLWGESPNSAKPLVEAHEQVEIRVTVAPAPIADYARTAYRQSPATPAGRDRPPTPATAGR